MQAGATYDTRLNRASLRVSNIDFAHRIFVHTDKDERELISGLACNEHEKSCHSVWDQ